MDFETFRILESHDTLYHEYQRSDVYIDTHYDRWLGDRHTGVRLYDSEWHTGDDSPYHIYKIINIKKFQHTRLKYGV